MYSEKFSAWQVAVAIMLVDLKLDPWTCYRPYEWITDAVISTGLSGLTEHGGVTPCNTLQRDIREKAEFFVWADQEEPGEHPRGWVRVNTMMAIKNADIREIVDRLLLWRDAGMWALPSN